jgi:glutamine synthetase
MLGAGLKGIENNYGLPAPIEEDIFEMNPAERKAHGITDLPGNLYSCYPGHRKEPTGKGGLG